MNLITPRRKFLIAAPCGLAAVYAADSAVPDNFPSQPYSLVKEIVGASHTNPVKVRELLTLRPALANAAWDWGFGDWETALGAASHVGNREIAEILLAGGAHPTIFSATMLGQLEVVKAMVAARPGIQKTAGPHGITLLAHARAGGKEAEAVFEYLKSLGDAGGAAVVDLSEEEMEKLTGQYSFGSGPNDRIDVTRKAKQLSFQRKGGSNLRIHHVGERAFRPAGASSVRIRFGEDGVMTILDGDLVLKATRI